MDGSVKKKESKTLFSSIPKPFEGINAMSVLDANSTYSDMLKSLLGASSKSAPRRLFFSDQALKRLLY